MLLLLLTLSFQLLIFYCFSLLFRFKYNSRQFISLELIKGMMLMATISLVASFFIPLNLIYELSLFGLALIIFIIKKGWIGLNIKPIIKNKIFIFLVLLTAFVGSMSAFIYDTFLYYLPTIKWLDQFGMVKGLANFDFNFGQMSLWHILQASFNNTIDPTYKINASLICVFLIFVFEIKKFQFLLFLPIFYFFVASPSTDLVVYIFSTILMLNNIIQKDDNSINYGLIGATILVLIKPLSIILPFYFLYLYLKKKCFKPNVLTLIIVKFYFLLFVSKNIFLTGNPLFPLKLGILNLEFSVPKEMYELNDILVRFLGVSKSDFEKLPDFKTYSNWNDLDYFSFIINELSVSAYIYLFITVFVTLFLLSSILRFSFSKVLLSILILFKIGFIFYTSMQYRFIVDGLIIVICFMFVHLTISKQVIVPLVSTVALLFVFSNDIFKINDPNFTIRNRPKSYKLSKLLFSTNYYTSGMKSKIFNFKSNINLSHNLSYDLKQPTIPIKLLRMYLLQESHPELINPNHIKDGFKMVKNSEEDIVEIQEHLRFIKEYRNRVREN